MSRKLVVSDGTRERELQLVGRIVVGRDPTCDITHDHSLLSRRHAEFVSAGELVVVRDLGSRNGVFVNGTKTAEHTLSPGDIVQIGPLRAQYVLDTVPLSIAPDDHDAERTTVRRAVASDALPVTSALSPAELPMGEPAFAVAPSNEEDETRLISRRSVEPEPEEPIVPPIATPPSELMDEDEDDDATRFIPAQRRNVELGEAPPAPAVAAVVPAPAQSLRMFVFYQVVVLGGLVIAAAAVSFSLDGFSAPVTAFVVPVIVVLVGGYLVAGIIDRRFERAAAERRN